MAIFFFTEDISYRLREVRKYRLWIDNVLQGEKSKTGEICIIFCSDAYLRKINRRYLGRSYLTDVITFSNTEDKDLISGDIFISIERVRENAGLYSSSFRMELRRVIIHGVLHLCGYHDNTVKEQKTMRRKEDLSLSLFPSV